MKHDASSWGAEATLSKPIISRTLAKIPLKRDDFMPADVAFDCISSEQIIRMFEQGIYTPYVSEYDSNQIVAREKRYTDVYGHPCAMIITTESLLALAKYLW
jgi:hypothetical protein